MVQVRSIRLPRVLQPAWLAVAVTIASLHVSPGHATAAEKWPRKLELITQLKRGDFAALDRRLISIQRAFQAGDAGEWRLVRAFRAFAYADPGLKARLDEWVERMPRSYAARLARGVYHTHLAWLSRGEAIARHTNRKQIAAMRKFIDLARPDLKEALARNRHLSVAYLEQMSIAKLGGDAVRLFDAYATGIMFVSGSKRLHLALLDALDPKWIGTPKLHEMLRSFVARRRESSPLHESMARQFDLYTAEEHFQQRRHKQALAVYDRMIAKTDTAYVRYWRANVLFAMGRLNAASRDLERALALYPDYKRVLTALAEFKVDYKAWAEALAYYDSAIRLDPYNPGILVGRARVLTRMGRFDDAEADFDRALYYGNDDSDVHAARGQTLLTYRRDPDRAARALKRAVVLAPLDLRNWKLYSGALHELRDCEFVTVTATYLELCLRLGECKRPDAVHVSNLVGNFKRKQGCPQDFDMSHLRRFVPAPPPVTLDSNVRAMKLAGLKLDDPPGKVRRAYPGIEIVLPSDPRSASEGYDPRGWNYVSNDDSFKLRTTFSRNGRLLGVTLLNWFVYEGSVGEIRDRLIDKYGRPDKLKLGRALRMSYLQGGAGDTAARPSARLRIYVKLLDTPAKRCELPPHLRIGSTVAFLSMSLSDFAAAKRESRNPSRQAVEARARAGRREAAEYARDRARRKGSIHVRPTPGRHDGCDTPERPTEASPTTPGKYRLP